MKDKQPIQHEEANDAAEKDKKSSESLEKPKRKVSEKVMESLRKAQARKKELDEVKNKITKERVAKERLEKKVNTAKNRLKMLTGIEPIVKHHEDSNSELARASAQRDAETSSSDGDEVIIVRRKQPKTLTLEPKKPEVKKVKPKQVRERSPSPEPIYKPKIIFS